MQITLKQRDIELALKMYLASQGIALAGRSFDVEFTAGRKESGLLATIDIGPAESLAQAVIDSVKVAEPEAIVAEAEAARQETAGVLGIVNATLAEPEAVAVIEKAKSNLAALTPPEVASTTPKAEAEKPASLLAALTSEPAAEGAEANKSEAPEEEPATQPAAGATLFNEDSAEEAKPAVVTRPVSLFA